MNKYRDRIFNLAKNSNARLVLPEKNDKRIIAACEKLDSMGFTIININDYLNNKKNYIDYIINKPFTENWPEENIDLYLQNPLNFAMAMVACGDADGLIAGASTPTSEVLRCAIRIIGINPKSNWVSSIFLMISSNKKDVYTFSDCAVIPEPDSQQLAIIAADSARFHFMLTGLEPKVAFLSFSTKGSSNHYRVDRVQKAVEIFYKRFPNIICDGELQLDAAINPEISRIKSPDSKLSGRANVLIFPNLDAGNIAYKIIQQMGGFYAWGPLLQGLNKPVHDLSRGCSVDDIINVSAITAMQKSYNANI